jgi:di- and tripeptidase
MFQESSDTSSHTPPGTLFRDHCPNLLSFSRIPDTVIHALSKFISIPSVSSDPHHRGDCQQAAIWLTKCLSQLGAQATVVGYSIYNRKVHATNVNSLAPDRRSHQPPRAGHLSRHTTQATKTSYPFLWVRLMFPIFLLVSSHFCRHYDVISAPPIDWGSDPFTLSGRNGYLYGRGVTDNKGPIMAVACAAAELLGRRALGVDLVLLIEGEEEAGSEGFAKAVRKYKVVATDISSEFGSTHSPWCRT